MTGEQIHRSRWVVRYRWLLSMVLVMVSAVSFSADDNQADENGSVPQEAGQPLSAEPGRAMVRSQRDDQALARQFPDQAVWLEPEALPPLLGLYQPGQRAESRGGILLLADEGQTANGPLLAELRERLSRGGWSVLSVGVAEAPAFVAQARQRQSPAPAAPEGPAGVASVMIDVNDDDNGDGLIRYYRDQGRRLESGFAWLQSRGHDQPVIIAIGWSADLVRKALLQALSDDGRLIWLAPRFAIDDRADLTSGLMGARILDVQSATDPGGVGAARAALFRREGVAGYRRSVVAMAEVPGPVDGPAIAGRILGWLSL